MREKLTVYSFTPIWVEGKDHKIADALSRFPVFSPDISLDTELHEVMQCQRTFNASGMSAIHQAIDKEYECMIEAVLSRQLKFPDRHPINPLKSMISRLSVEVDGDKQLLFLDGTRVIVPSAARSAVISGLHTAHSGMTKMYNTARQLYYWPGMKSEIQGKVNNCATCQRYLPLQPRPELTFTPPSAALCSMHHVEL